MSTAAAVRGAAPATDLAAVRSLYLHIPFCERRCEYCDFASVAGLAGHEAYVAALRAEVAAVAVRLPGVVLDTVFVGGGTPSLLPPALLAAILDEVRAGFRLAADAEVTIEANPSSTDAVRAAAWRAAGVTRVSLGIQSLHPPTLRFLGRVHDVPRALAAVDEIRAAGIRRVSTDLIYAVPGLDDASWLDTLDRVLALGCGHLSAYELTVEPGTPLHRSVALGRAPATDPEAALRQQRLCLERSAAGGLVRYEVSNHARPGEECRHNLAYWANAPYLACGVGAHGHLPWGVARALGIGAGAPDSGPPPVAVRYWHDRHPAAYVRRVLGGGTGASPGRPPGMPLDPAAAVAGAEAVDAAAAARERLLVGLRRTTAGVELPAAALDKARALEAAGLLRLQGARAVATARGVEVLDALVVRLA